MSPSGEFVQRSLALVVTMSLQGEDALVAFESFSFLLKCLWINPPVSCDRKRRRLLYRSLNVASIVLSTVFYSYLLFSISLDSELMKSSWKSLIVSRMHDLYFVLRYITVIVVQIHVLANRSEITRLFRSLNHISSAMVLLANRKGVVCKVHFFGTTKFARSLCIFSVSYPFICMAVTAILLNVFGMKKLGGNMFQIVRLLYFSTYVHLWLQATLVALIVLSRYEILKKLFG